MVLHARLRTVVVEEEEHHTHHVVVMDLHLRCMARQVMDLLHMDHRVVVGKYPQHLQNIPATAFELY